MAKLIGTDPNQVPTNGDLGKLAYLDNPMVPIPASASAAGNPGELAYESGYLYVCVAQDTWQRVAIATW